MNEEKDTTKQTLVLFIRECIDDIQLIRSTEDYMNRRPHYYDFRYYTFHVCL